MTPYMNRIPYFGLCFTTEHMDLLYKRLTSRVLSAMLNANDQLYDSKLAELVTRNSTNDKDENNDDQNKSGKLGGKSGASASGSGSAAAKGSAAAGGNAAAGKLAGGSTEAKEDISSILHGLGMLTVVSFESSMMHI